MRSRSVAMVALIMAGLIGLALQPAGAKKKAPKTGFEKRNGESWTTHKEELKFLAQVDRKSKRADVEVIGKTAEGRPLHLVRVGAPKPPTIRQTRRRPTVLFVCTQHGNEPAGREACLSLLRDLAFTKNRSLLRQLRRQSILFIPTANPDGRAADTRGNSAGIDINRDHLNLETAEAQAMAAVVRAYRPDIVMDHHEYGPSLPVVYDDELLYLWPRNLNADDNVRAMAKKLAAGHIETEAEEEGYSADEYGQYELADNDIHQSAGDGDEGIARNAMGLRHSLGILVESAVTQDPRNGPGELVDESEVNRRRVASHMVVAEAVLQYMRRKGAAVARTTIGSAVRKTIEGRQRSEPVYFGGADNDPPEEDEMQDPPPCRYELTNQQASDLKKVFRLHGIDWVRSAGKVLVPMGQPAEPVIPLLLDERGQRHAVAGEPVVRCG